MRGLKQMKGSIFATLLLVATLVAAACGSDGPDAPIPVATPTSITPPAPTIPMATQAPPPTATAVQKPPPEVELPAPKQRIWPGIMHSAVAPRLLDPLPLDWQILDSNIIVVAEFVSASAEVDTFPGPPESHLPMHVLKFRASEYLKGTGPSEFTVEVLDYGPDTPLQGYSTREEALTLATSYLSQRNTEWDSEPGVLYLKGPLQSIAPVLEETGRAEGDPESTEVYHLANNDWLNQSSFAYTIDTLSRDWMPAKETQATGSSGNSEREFIEDGSAEPPATLALSSLRTRISEIENMLNSGDGSTEFNNCIEEKLKRPYWYRNWEPIIFKSGRLESGTATGTQFGVRKLGSVLPVNGQYEDFELYVTGEQAALFSVAATDDDDDPENGFSYLFKTTRPLVAGDYQFHERTQIWSQKHCNYRESHDDPGYAVWEVTVEAPALTLHEAFFDPVVIGTGMGADGANGALEPVGFTVGGMATEMTGLGWENEQVVLTINPHVSLSGQVLEFIELDGSVSLSLVADDAQVDEGMGAYLWLVESQPWEEGDLLMLRIRGVQPGG